jgi:hypothetical protein
MEGLLDLISSVSAGRYLKPTACPLRSDTQALILGSASSDQHSRPRNRDRSKESS